MLGAILVLVIAAAVAYAVTHVGAIITVLFLAAVLVLAYRGLACSPSR